jgi:predicted kinase
MPTPKDTPDLLGSQTGKVINQKPLHLKDAHYAMINAIAPQFGAAEVLLSDEQISVVRPPGPETGSLLLPFLPLEPFVKAEMQPGDSLRFGRFERRGLVAFTFMRCPHPPPELVVMIGLPGSGKTHWVRDFAKIGEDGPPVIISLDTLFPALSIDRKYNPEFSPVYHIIEEMGARMAVALGKDVVIDRTNYDKRSQERWARIADQTGAKMRYVYINRPIDQCLAEMKMRTDPSRKVPSDRLVHMAEQLHAPSEAEEVKVDFWPGDADGPQ